MTYENLKLLASKEGITIKHQEYIFAYFVTMGKNRDESYLLASGTIDNEPKTPVKPARSRKKPTSSRGAAQGSIWYNKDSVQWILSKLEVSMVDEVKRYLKANKLAEGMITKGLEAEAKGEDEDDLIQISEIKSFLSNTIREVNQDKDALTIKERLEVLPMIKLVLSSLAPVDKRQENVDRTIVEVREPSNGICQWCNREITIPKEMLIDYIEKTLDDLLEEGKINVESYDAVMATLK